MTEEWKKSLSKKYDRPLPEERKQPVKKTMKKGDKSFHSNPKKMKDEKPNRCLPLYSGLGYMGEESFCEKKDLSSITANAGLLFDKFCDHWSGPNEDPGKAWHPEKPKNKKAVKHQFLDAIVNHLNKNKERVPKLLSQYHGRRDRLVESLNGASCNFKTTWRFVSGLGMGHVLETGFVWHRILGVPYLPGSSVKGLIRAWADPKTDKDGSHHGWGDPVKWKAEYERLFGDEKDLGAGSLIVLDAVPIATPKLEVDIMNPHYGEYYTSKGKTPPADYLSPTPIFFLTVAQNTSFRFALAPRDVKDTDAVVKGFDLLSKALDNLGAGAKTAVGYGYFK